MQSSARIDVNWYVSVVLFRYQPTSTAVYLFTYIAPSSTSIITPLKSSLSPPLYLIISPIWGMYIFIYFISLGFGVLKDIVVASVFFVFVHDISPICFDTSVSFTTTFKVPSNCIGACLKIELWIGIFSLVSAKWYSFSPDVLPLLPYVGSVSLVQILTTRAERLIPSDSNADVNFSLLVTIFPSTINSVIFASLPVWYICRLSVSLSFFSSPLTAYITLPSSNSILTNVPSGP